MIRHIHLIDCDSTQDQLKEQLNNQSESEVILVSCENQTNGRGRGEKKWNALPGSLCFSFNLLPHKVISFTAIEVSVLVTKFFEEKGIQLKLKWPNDLWDAQGNKCAGILVQGSQNKYLVGIGVNLYSQDEALGGVFLNSFSFNKKSWALELSTYILEHRYTDTEVLKKDWLLRCGHLNQFVKITEGSEVTEGIFQGLGEFGEAEICTDGKISGIFNGSLRLV